MQYEEQYYADMGNAAEAEAQANMNAEAEYNASMQAEATAAHLQSLMPSNPMSVLTLFDADAKKLDQFVDYVCNTIQSGMDDPLKVLAMSKKMEYVTKRITERIKQESERELEKHGQKANLFGTEMAYGATYTRYDFKDCGDPQWKAASKTVEEREAFLKALVKSETIVDSTTGEVVTVKPAKKVQSFGIKTTVK